MATRREFFSVTNIARRALEFRANAKNPFSLWVHLTINWMLRRELDEKWKLPVGDLSAPEVVLPEGDVGGSGLEVAAR
jgi:hypothetical protein